MRWRKPTAPTSPRCAGDHRVHKEHPFVLIAIGGAAGTLVRYAVSRAAPVGAGTFPTTTLIINVTGALALGLLLGALTRHRPADTLWRPLVGVGVLGGYTTFSTFAVESVQLIRTDRGLMAAAYVTASIVVGVLAARLGERIAGTAPAMVQEDEA